MCRRSGGVRRFAEVSAWRLAEDSDLSLARWPAREENFARILSAMAFAAATNCVKRTILPTTSRSAPPNRQRQNRSTRLSAPCAAPARSPRSETCAQPASLAARTPWRRRTLRSFATVECFFPAIGKVEDYRVVGVHRVDDFSSGAALLIGEFDPVAAGRETDDARATQRRQGRTNRTGPRLRVDLTLAFRHLAVESANDVGLFFRRVVVIAERLGGMPAERIKIRRGCAIRFGQTVDRIAVQRVGDRFVTTDDLLQM